MSLLIRGPAGAPCAPAVPWAHPWAGAHHHGAPRRAHVAAVARCQKVPRLAGRAQRDPLATPLNACWRLAALPARATCGGGLSACARGCRWHSLRNNARASRAVGAAAMPPLHCPASGALSRPRAHKPCRAARPLPLAACRWPHLVGPGRPALCRALAVRPGPDFITGLFRALAPSAALARTRARLAGALQPAMSPLSRAANLGATAPSPPEPQRRRRALLLILIP